MIVTLLFARQNQNGEILLHGKDVLVATEAFPGRLSVCGAAGLRGTC